MKKFLTLVLLFAAATSAPAAIVWVGGTDTNFYTASNWDFSGSSVTEVEFNASSTIADSIIMENAIGISLDGAVSIVDGFSLSLNNSSLTSTGGNGLNGGASGGATVNVNLSGTSSLSLQFINNGVFVNVGGTSTLSLRGTGNPINTENGNSRVNLDPGGSLVFANTTEYGEHRGKIFNTATGRTLSSGPEDFNPATGNIITAIPEPSFILIGGLGFLGLLRRRR